MQLWILLGLLAVLGIIGGFIMFAIYSAVDSTDASRIDDVPQNDFNNTSVNN